MFNQYEPNIKATISFLRLLKVKVNNATVNETLQNHPDWPTLLCVSDSLNKWKIPNGAGKIDTNKMDELPTPFIAYTNNRENPMALVTRVENETVELFQKNYSKANTEDKASFLKKWNGVYLIAEPGEHSGEPGFKTNKQQAFLNSLILITAFLTVVLLSFLLLRSSVGNTTAASLSATGIYLQFFILLAGVIVTTLLLWYEIDKNNPLLQKVCTGIAKGNCSAILSGKQSKLFSWLSWSEVGFFYFAGSLLLLVFAANPITHYIGIVAWLNILALPYTVFSIYYQGLVAKQWCVLCLAVQALLFSGGLNVIVNGFLLPFPHYSFSLATKFGLLYLLPVLLWFSLKPTILRLQKAKNTKREYLRIKFNSEIFETLLKKQKAITYSTDGLGIDLGNPAASNTLIKVCNPYCGPCAKAHAKIEALLEQNENLQVKIIFTTANEESNHSLKPTRHLMAVAEQLNDKQNIKHSLDDWYLADKKDYELFATKYPMNGGLLKQGDKIEAMDKWCKAMEINFTPTIFINGQQLPDAYNIEDLEYFLLE
jgi:uncharacterized membrane protein